MPDPSTLSYSVNVSFTRGVKAELRIVGDGLRREDLERLKKQLVRVVESIDEAFVD